MHPRQATILSSVEARRGARRLWSFALVCSLFCFWCLAPSAGAAAASNESFSVIVNAHNPTAAVDRRVLADVFLKKSTHWEDGESTRPADLPPNSTVRRDFSVRVLGRPVAAIRSYWQQSIFSGRDVPPPEFESDAAVMRYVAKNRGGVGYVASTTTLGAGIRVIEVR